MIPAKLQKLSPGFPTATPQPPKESVTDTAWCAKDWVPNVILNYLLTLATEVIPRVLMSQVFTVSNFFDITTQITGQ